MTDMNAVYSNVDDMLKKKVSLIESASTKIGAPNADDLTVPITFTLTPKEVSEHTAVSLDLNGELFPMEKNGTTFLVTIVRHVFGDALPKIVIDENGVKKTTQDNKIGAWSIMESVFPTLHPVFSGEVGFDGTTYRQAGKLSADAKRVESGVTFKEIHLVIKVDDQVISDKVIPSQALSFDYDMDEEIPLSNGQVCTMIVVATDSIGLEHHYMEDIWVAGAEHQGYPWSDSQQIYSAHGKLLWKSK